MRIEQVEDKEVWENFVQSFSPSNFLASWLWGDFNSALGEKVFRLGLFEADRLIGVCLAVEVRAKRGAFLLCPAGPLLRNYTERFFQTFLERLVEIAREDKLSFVRIRPLVRRGELKLKSLQDLKASPVDVHAQVSWLLSLDKSEEELLANMRKTTRYLIRQAEKLGVSVEEERGKQGLRTLEHLQEETVARQKFVPFSHQYLEKEFEIFSDEAQAKILTASHEGEPLASALLVFYGDSAFYHHGSSRESQVPASYLLQWEALKLAKASGKKFYNFWGIAPNDSPKHPWFGLSSFKKGFGGFKLEYETPRDIPTGPAYPIIYWFEKFRNFRRGLS